MTQHLVRFGDSRSLAFLPDESVNLVVTSPPYVTTEFYEGQGFDYDGHLELMREVLRKPGRRRVPQPLREASKLTTDEWRRYTQQWWRIESISERYDGHGAVFPLEVPLRLVKMFSFVGDMVLDPFLGTGATTEAAVRAGRNSVGVELDAGAEKLVERRVAQLRQNLLASPFELRYEHELPEKHVA